MRVFLLTLALLACTVAWSTASGLERNLVCFYDSNGVTRAGPAQFSTADLEIALQFCTHVIYGYVGINSDTFQLMSLNENLDIQRRHFATITALKEKFPYTKFLLSVGGDRDAGGHEKYISLLEAGRQKQTAFIESARDFLRSYNFDGLDLAFQLPRNKPRKVHSDVGAAWKSFKKFFTGDFIVDEKADEHKEEFTDLVRDLKNTLRVDNYLLSLTVLPNVNSSWYFNAPAIADSLDLINLATFDFLTPERNPEEADFSAPLYELHDQNRLPHYNINYQVENWLLQRVPASKLHVGVAAYGRAWKMTKDSGTTGLPIVRDTDGAAPAGPLTKTPGLLNWLEVCQRLPNPSNVNAKGADAPLRRISDPTKRYGTYAFHTADEDGSNGVWVSYEDPDTAASKAGYVKAKNLGGVALFDLTLDDFRGQCTGDKFPMLRAIKYRLL
ncbi:chitinase-like protein Idgf3 [Ceratitis capitata]|uniref:Chitinase-like protein Idgf3 n=1 Tax=Ceratitis capitata TaxID=7213 RepID=W8B5G5_CERCA|nr:chitinase-like protein Idgf3 [Ceratitis capitata]